jgi:uncharacterized protein (DUF58 family)
VKRLAVKPDKRLLWLLIVPLVISVIQSLLLLAPQTVDWAASLQALLGDLWLFVLVVAAVVIGVDYANALKQPQLSFSRKSKDILSLHRWSPVTLTIRHNHSHPQRIIIRELVAPSLEVSDFNLDCDLKPALTSSLEYKVRPAQRGDAIISGLEILHHSAFRLWHAVWHDDTATTLKVYPDFEAINGYSLMATDNHISQFGIKRTQKRGEGMEFHQLREYQRGDTSRQIDWKATARKQKIISRDYQDERDQQIIVLLDNGRRMRSEDDGLGHLDHAVNAMSLLSHIALKQGDAVGLMSFGIDQRWLPCKKGSAHINTILNHVYDLQPGVHATDYSGAAQTLLKMQRKRSLVILITNTRDEDVDDLLPAIKLIGKNHLVLLANIREPILQQTLDEPVTNIDEVYRYCGTIDYLYRRQQVRRQLTDAGVFVVDAQPQNLAIEVCNGYLEIKRSGYL